MPRKFKEKLINIYGESIKKWENTLQLEILDKLNLIIKKWYKNIIQFLK
jgi:hypothetical protein